MAILPNAQDDSTFSDGPINPKARHSIARTRSQYNIPEAGEPNVSLDPLTALLSKLTASSTELIAWCKSSEDLSNGTLQTVLDRVETSYKCTLEDVQLIVPHADVDPSPVYRHAVHSDRFPALRSLYIGGFFPTPDTMYTFHNLRRLRLCSFYRDLDGTLMSLHEFFAVLRRWTRLEELELRGYYPALAFSEGQCRPPTVALPHLRKLTIADVPESFPVMLPCLRLQPKADVHLIALHHSPAYPGNPKEAFSALSFQDRGSNFPMLGEVHEVTISTESPEQEDYGLRVAGRSANGSFTYDVRTTASVTLLEDVEFRRCAVDWALQAVPMLFKSGTHIRTVRCAASFRDVDEKSWVGVFQAYSALEELMVDGSGTVDLSRLFIALRWPSRGSNVMCRTLRRLVVHGAVYTPTLMEVVVDCFLYRRRYSGDTAVRTALQLDLAICDHAYPPGYQARDVAKLKESGVDAEICTQSVWDVLRALEQKAQSDQEL